MEKEEKVRRNRHFEQERLFLDFANLVYSTNQKILISIVIRKWEGPWSNGWFGFSITSFLLERESERGREREWEIEIESHTSKHHISLFTHQIVATIRWNIVSSYKNQTNRFYILLRPNR